MGQQCLQDHGQIKKQFSNNISSHSNFREKGDQSQIHSEGDLLVINQYLTSEPGYVLIINSKQDST